MGTGCSHYEIDISVGGATGGGSGAPVLADIQGAGPVVTGIYTHGDSGGTCHASVSIFGKMYEDGRVEGALTYGDDYFTRTGMAANFDDRARPRYAFDDDGDSGGGGSATGYITLFVLAGLLLLTSFNRRRG